MSSVAGVFNNKMQADKAFAELLDAGFNKEDISLLISDNAHKSMFSPSVDDQGERATRGGAAGALWGGALGVLIAGLTAVGSIVVPGIGLLASGPIVAIFSGAGAGAAIGGLSGALISAGFAVDDANRYEAEVKSGKAVLIIHTDSDNESKARRILSDMDANVKAA